MMLGYALAIFPLTYAAIKDYRDRIIPNWCSLVILLCAILNITLGYIEWWEALVTAVFLFALFAGIAIFSKKTSAIGGGDIKITVALATLLGFNSLIVILIALLLLLIICKARNYNGYAFAVCVLLSYSVYLGFKFFCLY